MAARFGRFALIGALLLSGIATFAWGDGASAETHDEIESYTSPTFGYSLEWDEALWGVTEELSEDGYDLLTLETGGAALYIEGVYFYGGDPDECLIGEVERILDDEGVDELYPMVDDEGAEIAESGDGYAYALYELPSVDDADEIAAGITLECRTLVPGEVVLILTGFFDPADIDGYLGAIDEVVGSIQIDAVDENPIEEADLEQIVRQTGNEINAFWAAAFEEMGAEYEDPLFITFTGPTETECGDATPGESGSFYCPADGSVYLDVEDNMENDLDYGVVFFQVVLAHEIGHHVQALLELEGCDAELCGEPGSSLAIELQADCFAGAWTQNAAANGEIAGTEMARVEIGMKTFMGDPIDTPKDDPDAHGTGEERFAMYDAGYTEGLGACGIS